MTSVHFALAVNGHLDMVGRERVRERPLCRGQIVKTQWSHSQTVKAGVTVTALFDTFGDEIHETKHIKC